MPVIAVVNRKGGSGKSTLATHLAAHFANSGANVLLGDVDRQQSTRTWLRQRNAVPAADRPEIKVWPVDPKFFARPPGGADHVVLDTPGGLTGLDLARVVMYADAILMPVCNSLFDRESAAECLAELRTLPRVVSGRCKLAAIGMRLDARTEAAGVVQAWATEQRVSLIAVLRESNAYVRCIEKGLTVFDLPADDLAQWKPIVKWLRPLMEPAQVVTGLARDGVPPAVVRRHDTMAMAHERRGEPVRLDSKPVHPVRLPAAGASAPARGAPVTSHMSRLLDALPIPRFLQRTP